jgi:hypothetical protein
MERTEHEFLFGLRQLRHSLRCNQIEERVSIVSATDVERNNAAALPMSRCGRQVSILTYRSPRPSATRPGRYNKAITMAAIAIAAAASIPVR